MKYTLVLHDGTKHPFESAHYDFIKERMTDGGVFELAGALLRGSDIKRVIKGADLGQYGPHSTESNELLSIGAQVFGTQHYEKLFWKQVIDQNRIREGAGEPWVFGACVNWAAAECRHQDVPELFRFITAEWETAKDFNVRGFPNDNQDVGLQRSFFATEEGRAYAHRWKGFDVQWKREQPVR